jgi:hypothetical protein
MEMKRPGHSGLSEGPPYGIPLNSAVEAREARSRGELERECVLYHAHLPQGEANGILLRDVDRSTQRIARYGDIDADRKRYTSDLNIAFPMTRTLLLCLSAG